MHVSGNYGKWRKAHGQVVAEYVIVLALSLTLVLALVFLIRAISTHGDDAVEQIGSNVP